MPATFVDRDGVINEHVAGGYVLSPEEFRWLPGALESLRRLGASGRPLIVVSNQSCINRGLLTVSTLRSIMSDMLAVIQAGGATCAGWICCPHRPDEGCECRKPGTAMLKRAAEQTGVDLAGSILIGDSTSDIEAAERAGMKGVLVGRNDPRALTAAVDDIIGRAV